MVLPEAVSGLPDGRQEAQVFSLEAIRASRLTEAERMHGLWQEAIAELGDYLINHPEEYRAVYDVVAHDLAVNYPEQLIPMFSAMADYVPSGGEEDQDFALDDLPEEEPYGDDDPRYLIRMLAGELIDLAIIQDDIRGTKLAIKLTKDSNPDVVESVITTLQFKTGFNQQTGKREEKYFSPKAHHRLWWIAEEHLDNHLPAK